MQMSKSEQLTLAHRMKSHNGYINGELARVIGAGTWRRSRRAVSRPQIAQARGVSVEKDSMDAIVCYGEQERCEWLVLLILSLFHYQRNLLTVRIVVYTI